MKLNACWALPVYLVLEDQSHWKMCEQILRKTQRTHTIQILWILKKTMMSPIIAAIASTLLIKDLSILLVFLLFICYLVSLIKGHIWYYWCPWKLSRGLGVTKSSVYKEFVMTLPAYRFFTREINYFWLLSYLTTFL